MSKSADKQAMSEEVKEPEKHDDDEEEEDYEDDDEDLEEDDDMAGDVIMMDQEIQLPRGKLFTPIDAMIL